MEQTCQYILRKSVLEETRKTLKWDRYMEVPNVEKSVEQKVTLSDGIKSALKVRTPENVVRHCDNINVRIMYC